MSVDQGVINTIIGVAIIVINFCGISDTDSVACRALSLYMLVSILRTVYMLAIQHKYKQYIPTIQQITDAYLIDYILYAIFIMLWVSLNVRSNQKRKASPPSLPKIQRLLSLKQWQNLLRLLLKSLQQLLL